MTKCRSNSSTTSLGSSSGRKVLSDTDTSQVSNSQNPSSAFISEGQETQEARFKSQSARTTSARAVLPLASMKPSGLRLRSPKIGFFDGGKSLVRTPRGGMEPHIANYRKASVFGKLDVINHLHPHKVANYKKNYDQVDCLSRRVGLVDTNLGSQKKFIGDRLSFSHSDVSFQDKSKGLELSCQELLNCRKMDKSMNGPRSPSFDMPPYTRRPLTPKNSFCNMDGFFSVLQNQKLQS